MLVESAPADGGQVGTQQSSAADSAASQSDLLSGLSQAGSPSETVSSEPTQVAQQPQRGFRDVVADTFGYQNARQYESDEAFVSSLIQDKVEFDARRRDLELADSVKGNWDQYQNFLRTQQSPQQMPAKEEKPWFNPPPYDRSLDAQMRRDDNGVVRFLDGQLVPQHVLTQRFEHYRYINDFKEKLASEPEKALAPLFDSFEKRLESKFSGFRDEERKFQSANSILDQNQHWIFTSADRSQLTPAGQLYQRNLEEAKSIGIMDAAARDQYAQLKMEANYYRSQQQQDPQQQQQVQQPMSVGEAKKQQFLAATRKPRNGSGAGQLPTNEPDLDNSNLFQSLSTALKDVETPWGS